MVKNVFPSRIIYLAFKSYFPEKVCVCGGGGGGGGSYFGTAGIEYEI